MPRNYSALAIALVTLVVGVLILVPMLSSVVSATSHAGL